MNLAMTIRATISETAINIVDKLPRNAIAALQQAGYSVVCQCGAYGNTGSFTIPLYPAEKLTQAGVELMLEMQRIKLQIVAAA